jgi:predicted anti-sigma-YlaC factor YlaD
MTGKMTLESIDCARARRALDDRMDGPLDPGREADLTAHLARCAACREHEAGLLLVRSALRSLPRAPLPDEALDAVWARTIAAPSPRLERPARWAAVAAAVLVAGLALVLVRDRGPSPTRPSQAEIAQAASEARLVLGLTARAMQRSESAATRQVLAGEVKPALDRIPIRWSDDGSDRRSGT